MRTVFQVFLIEGNKIGSLGLTLTLARLGHIVCRVQDLQASMLGAPRTLFDLGVIDMKARSERLIDLPVLVRFLGGVQRGLPITRVGSELGGKDRYDITRVGGISLLAKARVPKNLLEAVSAAIFCGNFHSPLSGGASTALNHDR